MRPQVLKTEIAQYVPQAWAGENQSGWRPFGDTVLVMPDLAAEKMGAMGLIHVPQDLQDRHSLASETGIIVAVGEAAFAKVGADARPKPGQRVIFARYSGRVIVGDDSVSYRAMDSDCIAAVKDDRSADRDFGIMDDTYISTNIAGLVAASKPKKGKKSNG